MVNGRFHQKYRGSLFLIAIILTGVLSMLYIGMSESYQTARLFSQRAKEYYQIQIMKELFLNEFFNLPEEKKEMRGEVHYNVGKVTYDYQITTLNLTIDSLHYQRKFTQTLVVETTTPTQSTESVEVRAPENKVKEKQIEKETDTEQTSQLPEKME